MSLREKAQTAELRVPPTCLETARGHSVRDLLGCARKRPLQPWPAPGEKPQEGTSAQGWASLPLPLPPQLRWYRPGGPLAPAHLRISGVIVLNMRY